MSDQTPLAPIREGQGDTEERKKHYGDGVQPWDIIVASGWGHAFAAGNVIKYLRRSKNPEHSIESACWYYDRLVEGAAKATDYSSATEAATGVVWADALARLELILTPAERLIARRLA